MANIKESLAVVTSQLSTPMFTEEGRLAESFAFLANVNVDSEKTFFGGNNEERWTFAFTPIADKAHKKEDFEKLFHKLGITEGRIFGVRPSSRKVLVVFNLQARDQFTTFDYNDIRLAFISSNDEEEKLVSQFYNAEESADILREWNAKHPRNVDATAQPSQTRANRPTIGVMRG